ncbi:MAG: hypothetical protein V1913_00870 [Fibrobacterota bacterium]
MASLSKRIAQFLSLFVFFVLLIAGIFSSDSFTLAHLPMIVLKAFIGYVIFWLLGIVLSDIVLKAVMNAMEDKKYETWEGGLLDGFSADKNADLKKSRLERKA